MHLILHKNAPWKDFCIETGEGDRRPYSVARSDAADVFVLGYPYDATSAQWLDCARILDLYSENNSSLTDRLEGSFAIVILDHAALRCLVIVDPYKIYTLFHGRPAGDRLVISDGVEEIARRMDRIGLDNEGILQFTNFGFLIGDRTVIEGVRSFRAASVHTIDRYLDIRSEPYWNIAGGMVPGAAATKEDVAGAFDAHMSKGLSLGGRISMPLTGGLDSRTVLSSCINDKGRLHCYTHGRRDSDDVKISAKIAHRFGIPWDFYEIGDGIVREIPVLAASMTGACNGLLNVVMSSHFLPSYEKESARGDIFFSGIGGELFRSYYMTDAASAAGSMEGFAGALRARIHIPSEPDVFAGMNGKDAAKKLDAAVLDEFSLYGSDDRQLLSDRFYLENRVGNFTALSMRLIGEYFNLFNPFLERNMLNLVAALPAEAKRGMGIQKLLIERNNPGLGRILMDRARTLTHEGGPARMAQIWQRAFVLARIYSNKLSGKQLFNFSFTDYDWWLKEYHRDYVLDLLDHDGMVIGSLLDRNGLDKLKTRFFGTRSGLCPFVTNIMSTELFLRYLVEGTGTGARPG